AQVRREAQVREAQLLLASALIDAVQQTKDELVVIHRG
ncbi:hypothetical protein A2U01_0105878, partial [Trifolium medium]|nr:hypothetical protein [Trifolium medium]